MRERVRTRQWPGAESEPQTIGWRAVAVGIHDDVDRCAVESIASVYRDRSTRFAQRARQRARSARIVLSGRLLAFWAAVGCLLLASSNPAARGVGLAGCGLLLGCWAALVVLHDRLRDRRKRFAELHEINEHSLACTRRSWDEIPLADVEVPESEAALAGDLDLFGWGSLFHLVCRAHTPMGIATLRDWLLSPAKPAVIRERQRAVAELAPELDLRHELELRGRILARSPEAFLDWTEGPPWLAERPLLRRVSIALGVLPSLSVAIALAGLVPGEAGMAATCLACLVNLLFTATFAARIQGIFRRASSRHAGVREYVASFDLMAHVPGTSGALAALRQTAADPQHGACARLRDLRRILRLGNISSEPLFKLLVYLPLQVFFLWDFHLLAFLENWQRRW
jgi:hypothetical protein